MSGENFGINCHWRSELLWIVIFHFLLVKIKMNAVRLCKLCKDCLTGIGQGATHGFPIVNEM
jgi:hypothetical protein